MGDRAHVHLHQTALHRDGRHVLLLGGVGDTGLQHMHLLAAALHGHLGGGELGDDIAAMFADIELHIEFSFFRFLKYFQGERDFFWQYISISKCAHILHLQPQKNFGHPAG